MKFFIPTAKEDQDAQNIYEATKKFAKETSLWNITDRKIYSIRYVHEGKEYVAKVGQIEPRTKEHVIAILESNAFLVCTTHRGVLGGEPMLVGHEEIRSIEDFE